MTQEDLLAGIEKAKQSGLKNLSLSSTDIKELPPEIGQLTNLTYLDLSSTQLTKLPDEIGKLTNLKYLNLSSTQLTKCHT
jgi:Leucine-rich repeat (LRR) protein